jgi:thymidylate synthase
MKIYKTTHEAYLSSLSDIYFNPEYKNAPRGQPCREKTDYTFRILEPTSEPIVTEDEERNEVVAEYTQKEMALYESCSNSVEDFAKASKFWQKLANPDGTINSAYGYLIWKNKSCGNLLYEKERHGAPVLRTPWQWCVETLKADKDTRQAILRFSLPEHQYVGNLDQTCTLSGLFLIREDKLNLSIVMRSNDFNKGTLFDLPFFCSLIDKMVEELRPCYPTLTKGHYTHTAHSAHIYEKDETVVLKMLGTTALNTRF